VKVVVEPGHAGARLDVFVAGALGVSTSEARRRIAAGDVLVGGRARAKGHALAAGDDVEIREAAGWLVPAAVDWLEVAFADEEVIVVDKPAGVPCHPLERGEGGTLVDAVAARYPDVADASADAREGGLVHRLDTGTSGLVAVARTRAAHAALRAAIAAAEVEREYLALVAGRLDEDLILDQPIAHDPRDARRMVCARDGVEVRGEPRAATTFVDPVALGEDCALVCARIEGGRRHQVRVHLAEAGYPLLGDALYGGPPLPGRQGHALHASALRLPGRERLTSPLPGELARAARDAGLEVPDALLRPLDAR
jgi:23S rRNA pseudouridine1911/1915/1917 synthase